MIRYISVIAVLFLCFNSLQGQNQSVLDQSSSVKSQVLKNEVKYSIYLPAGYASASQNYPVVYLLHPAGPANTVPNNESWYGYGQLKSYLDDVISKGDIQPMVVVTPDANYGTKRISYFNDPAGDFNYEDFFFREFVPFIEKNYRVSKDKMGKAIAGASLGGAAALQYAIHEPDAFGTVVSLSGAVRGYVPGYLKNRYPDINEEILKKWYQKYDVLSYFDQTQKETKIDQAWLVTCGDDDALSVNNAKLHISMADKKIKHEFRIHDGAHDWDYWKKITPELFAFLSNHMKEK
ncbi:alpha/beta hydrolase [Sphingobacterium sp. UBA5996]|uniref:alpha/beta hydrolase n=1 Tax=Sphingobacterium sp. UBA5996 TaxID=1947505 RepID=UPI0025E1606C|nr:alpha/beta hydrolase-fold protein [Sphingobacterium sp. UBA5996]